MNKKIELLCVSLLGKGFDFTDRVTILAGLALFSAWSIICARLIVLAVINHYVGLNIP